MGDRGWELTDHLCRACLGRLLLLREPGGTCRVRCAECEIEATGGVRALCACGARLRSGRPAGLACRRNPAPSPEVPARVVVVYVGDAGGLTGGVDALTEGGKKT